MKLRLPEIDILKAAAILLIVFCHMDNYISNYGWIQLIDGYVAIIGLSIFFFASGFLLSYTGPVINSLKDVKNFYMSKFIRIFPLYWVAIVSLVIIFGLLQIDPGNVQPYDFSQNNFLIHFLGLQGIFPSFSIQSMWFVGVIVLFFLIYPFITYFSTKSSETLAIAAIIFILFISLHFSLGLIHLNAIVYYPLFISGILANQIIYSSKIIDDAILLKRVLVLNITFFSVILLIIVFSKLQNISSLFFFTVLIMCAMIPLCNSCLIFIRLNFILHGRKVRIISLISFGTYAIYLFQHQFLAVFTQLIDVVVLNIIIQDMIILTFGFFGVIVFGVIIQGVEQRIFQRHKSIAYDNEVEY